MQMGDQLDGNYTRMLRTILGVLSKKENKTNKELYRELEYATDIVWIRRQCSLDMAGDEKMS